MNPEPQTHQTNDAMLAAVSWAVQDYNSFDPSAFIGITLRGKEADFGPKQADTFRHNLHPDLRADYVLANPPFNDFDWFLKDDVVAGSSELPPCVTDKRCNHSALIEMLSTMCFTLNKRFEN